VQELLLGIDIGTSGCKTTIIDTKGNFISYGITDYVTHHPRIGWAEQCPSDWFPAFLKALKISVQKSNLNVKNIIGISLSASAHNAVLLGSNDRILRNTIMWTDQRSSKESEFLKNEFGHQIFPITYQMPAPTWTLPQLMWIRNNEPQVFNNISRIMFIKDYVRYLLTDSWTTDYIEAQGSLMFDNIHHDRSLRTSLAGFSPISLS
jgi:xylulokinase